MENMEQQLSDFIEFVCDYVYEDVKPEDVKKTWDNAVTCSLDYWQTGFSKPISDETIKETYNSIYNDNYKDYDTSILALQKFVENIIQDNPDIENAFYNEVRPFTNFMWEDYEAYQECNKKQFEFYKDAFDYTTSTGYALYHHTEEAIVYQTNRMCEIIRNKFEELDKQKSGKKDTYNLENR